MRRAFKKHALYEFLHNNGKKILKHMPFFNDIFYIENN